MKPRPITIERAQRCAQRLQTAQHCERVKRLALRAAARTYHPAAPVWRSLAVLCDRRRLELQEAFADAY